MYLFFDRKPCDEFGSKELPEQIEQFLNVGNESVHCLENFVDNDKDKITMTLQDHREKVRRHEQKIKNKKQIKIIKMKDSVKYDSYETGSQQHEESSAIIQQFDNQYNLKGKTVKSQNQLESSRSKENETKRQLKRTAHLHKLQMDVNKSLLTTSYSKYLSDEDGDHDNKEIIISQFDGDDDKMTKDEGFAGVNGFECQINVWDASSTSDDEFEDIPQLDGTEYKVTKPKRFNGLNEFECQRNFLAAFININILRGKGSLLFRGDASVPVF